MESRHVPDTTVRDCFYTFSFSRRRKFRAQSRGAQAHGNPVAVLIGRNGHFSIFSSKTIRASGVGSFLSSSSARSSFRRADRDCNDFVACRSHDRSPECLDAVSRERKKRRPRRRRFRFLSIQPNPPRRVASRRRSQNQFLLARLSDTRTHRAPSSRV